MPLLLPRPSTPDPSRKRREGASFTVPEPDAGLLGVDGVEDTLVPDLALGREADHAPDVRLRRSRRRRHRRRPRLGFRSPAPSSLVSFFFLYLSRLKYLPLVF